MDIDIDTTMETKPTKDREEKLRKVEEKLFSKKTNERFTDYEGVLYDPKLTLAEKIIHFQKGIEDSTRRKIYYASLQGKLLEECFQQSKKVYEEALKDMKIEDSGHNSYENCITVNLTFVLFLYVFFALTSR